VKYVTYQHATGQLLSSPVKVSEINQDAPCPYGSGEDVVMPSEIFVNIVDEGLARLGEGTKNVIYEALEADYAIRRQEIPIKFVEFSGVLHDILGPAIDPLLQFIVNSFLTKINKEAAASTDLNEAIQAVAQILRDY